MVEQIKTYEQFKNLLQNEEKVILLDLYATWCGPCKMQAPIIDSFAEQNLNVKVIKIDVDENSQVAIDYGVNSIPTLLIFKNGELKEKQVGLTEQLGLQKLVEKYI